MSPGIYSWVQFQPITGWQPDDTPSGSLRVQLTIHKNWVSGYGDTKTCVLEYVDGATHLTRYFGEESASISGTTSDNGRWALIATATPPQEFDLPLANGITALQPCTYWKNQFGEVTIYGCTYGSVTEGETIATLPEGFRPDHPVEWPASFTGDGGRVSGTVFISESGIVSIHTTAPAMSVVFAASFLAAG